MKEENNKQEILPFYELDYKKLNGVVPATILDAATGIYLMTGYMNPNTYRETTEIGQVVFYSRGRKVRWHKGATSGNWLDVVDIKKGCEDDILQITVNPKGPVCHRNTWTCFDNPLTANITREQRFGSGKSCPLCGK